MPGKIDIELFESLLPLLDGDKGHLAQAGAAVVFRNALLDGDLDFLPLLHRGAAGATHGDAPQGPLLWHGQIPP